MLALKNTFSLPPSGLIFFPLFLLICGELSNFFTVGGNKSQTVSDYLKNKTTHTQNKTKLCAANC